MKALTFNGELWHFVEIDELRALRRIALIDIVKALMTAFQFAGGPNAIPEKDQGLVFREGVLKTGDSSIAIERLEVFGDGVHVSVGSTTDDADRVFSAIKRLLIEIGGRDDLKTRLSYHVSTIVADFSNNIDGLISSFTEISNFVSSKLDHPTKLRLNSLAFLANPLDNNYSRLAFQNLNPSLFRIEPRANSASENRYFSIANMTTENHLKVLQMLDDKFAKSK